MLLLLLLDVLPHRHGRRVSSSVQQRVLFRADGRHRVVVGCGKRGGVEDERGKGELEERVEEAKDEDETPGRRLREEETKK